MGKFEDLTGQRFGKLVAVNPVDEPTKSGHHKRWVCQCDCGGTATVTSDHLKKGDIKSCGCINHGQTGTRLYRIWSHMRSRCQNPKDENYKHYGARGITVCQEWAQDFLRFYNWAISSGYNDGLTIDRIDNSKGYLPENCRWADMSTQANNTRSNRKITYNGETKTLAEWARIIGVKQNTLLYRLKRGWSIERAFSKQG